MSATELVEETDDDAIAMALAVALDPTMPQEAAVAFRIYANDADRSLNRTARMTATPIGTIRSWSYRYGWRSLLKREETEADAGSMERAVALAASIRIKMIDKLVQVATMATKPVVVQIGEGRSEIRHVEDFKTQADAAAKLLDRIGLKPGQMTVTRTFDGLESEEEVALEELVKMSSEELIASLIGIRSRGG